MRKLFINANVVTIDKVLEKTNVLVENGVITDFSTVNVCADEVIDCQGNYLVAGFVDIHCHGGGGADFMDGSVEAMETAVRTHLLHGTTTIYPTTMSAEMSEIENTFNIL